MREISEGDISRIVWYLDLGDGYMSVFTYQNVSNCTPTSVHFIVCTSIKEKI